MTTQQFDFESLTLEEVETIELISGSSIDELMDEGKPKGKGLKAIVFVANKRTNPNYTLDEAGKVSLKEAQKIFVVSDDPKE